MWKGRKSPDKFYYLSGCCTFSLSLFRYIWCSVFVVYSNIPYSKRYIFVLINTYICTPSTISRGQQNNMLKSTTCAECFEIRIGHMFIYKCAYWHSAKHALFIVIMIFFLFLLNSNTKGTTSFFRVEFNPFIYIGY